MNWKFWKKSENADPSTGGKTQRPDKPRDLPQEVGRHLVVEHNLDPDWVWSLKCFRKPRENSKTAFDIRIFSREAAAQRGVKISSYDALGDQMDLVLFAGWYDKQTHSVQLEKLIKKAV